MVVTIKIIEEKGVLKSFYVVFTAFITSTTLSIMEKKISYGSCVFAISLLSVFSSQTAQKGFYLLPVYQILCTFHLTCCNKLYNRLW